MSAGAGLVVDIPGHEDAVDRGQICVDVFGEDESNRTGDVACPVPPVDIVAGDEQPVGHRLYLVSHPKARVVGLAQDRDVLCRLCASVKVAQSRRSETKQQDLTLPSRRS